MLEVGKYYILRADNSELRAIYVGQYSYYDQVSYRFVHVVSKEDFANFVTVWPQYAVNTCLTDSVAFAKIGSEIMQTDIYEERFETRRVTYTPVPF